MESILDFIATWAVWISGFVIAFGLAVFVHELGHFLAARAFGVKADRFVLGMDREAIPYWFIPKCIWEKKIGDTTYGISLLPLGGYVRLEGTVHPDIEKYLEGDGAPAPGTPAASDAPAVAPQSLTGQTIGDQAALYKKPFWQKTIVYGAGVTMNMILAMVLAVIVVVKGEKVNAPQPPIVAWQPEGSWVLAAGLEPGDRIVRVGDDQVQTDKQFYSILEQRALDAAGVDGESVSATVFGPDLPTDLRLELPLRVRRGIDEIERTIAWPSAADLAKEGRTAATLFAMPAYIDDIIPTMPADKAGMMVGDTIVAIDGQAVADWNQVLYIVRGSANKPLAVTVERARDGARAQVDLTVTPHESTDEEGIGQIGVISGTPTKDIERLDLASAVVRSPLIVASMTVRYVERLGLLGSRLAEGEIGKVRRELGGPVAVATMAGRRAEQGPERFIKFMIALNIALAVMNLLPLPVLDGGHIMFGLYEAIVGRPVPPQILVPVIQTSVYVLLGFVVLITFSDVLRIFF